MAPKPALIVDDAVDIRLTLSLVFEALGIQTLEAGNGLEALELLRSGTQPGLILLDWMMPVLDGRAFLEQWSTGSECDKPPVYVLSALDRQPDLNGVSVCGWLKKPVSYLEIMTLARRHLLTNSRDRGGPDSSI